MKSVDACVVIRSVQFGIEEELRNEFELSVCSRVSQELRGINSSKIQDNLEYIREMSSDLETPDSPNETIDKIQNFLNSISIDSIASAKKEDLEKVGYFKISSLDEGETHMLANSTIKRKDIITDDFEAYEISSKVSENKVECLIECIAFELGLEGKMKKESIEILDKKFSNYDELSPSRSSEIIETVEAFNGPAISKP